MNKIDDMMRDTAQMCAGYQTQADEIIARQKKAVSEPIKVNPSTLEQLRSTCANVRKTMEETRAKMPHTGI